MIKICEVCGKEYKTSHKRRKYCSQKCMGIAKTKLPKFTYCAYCGNKIYKNKASGKINKYCNLDCYHKDRMKINDQYKIKGDYVIIFVLYKKQQFEVLLDLEDFEKLKNQRICISKKLKDTTYYAQIRGKAIHRIILNSEKNEIVDHINHNGLDNRKSNLRTVSFTENNLNRNISKRNKSGCTGVCYRAKEKAWRVHYRGKEIGYFKNLNDAIRCRKEAEIKDPLHL